MFSQVHVLFDPPKSDITFYCFSNLSALVVDKSRTQIIKEFILDYIISLSTDHPMDLFQIPDDYKPEKPLTDQEVEDITNYLKGHPLFLKELPEDIESNEHLAALQTLVEDQDPEEQAEGLNKQANARIKQGPNNPYYMKDAYKKYTEAISLNPKTPELKAKLHCNRAAINLKYKNYGKVIQDCKISLTCDPNYIKAYYRMAKAYIGLKKYDDCIQLLATQTEPELKALSEEALSLKKKQEESKKKLQEKTHAFSNKIEEYFAMKKWRYAKKNQQLPQGVEIQFIDDKISIPLVVIYPEFNQFDLIAKTSENQKITECISELFANPLPWDAKGDYKANTIEIYTEIQEAVLLRLPKQATISQIASRAPVRGAIQIIILTNNAFASYYKNQYKIY